MKTILGICLGFFLISQAALAGDVTKNDPMEEATDQQGSAEQFEQTLQESPTAAGFADMGKKEGEMTEQAQEPMESDEEPGMSHEEPMKEAAEY
ncbi:hypothetical protein [Alkalimarinus sediminis]|uniref:Secreted protein n=1 Tax=Alkalimarinus sediminis TaxID=1632866 RepID=A0A9E8KQF0_9ALTE|nr:hypothetical protein [Alkalimarinus sediminis]UZW75125.1 hypothetical protein NNL22_00520 [Alkalimarinus sediminis]